MGELVDALVRVLEFIAQGFLAVLLGGYVLAWIHKIKNSVYEHANELTNYMLPNWKVWKVHPNVLIAICLGCLYLIGVVANAVGYWLLEPAHELVISEAMKSTSDNKVGPVAASRLVGIVKNRVFGLHNPRDEKAYVDYISDEVDWRNMNLEALKHALDSLLKQGRVIRGVAVIALGFLIVSIAKTASLLLCLLLLLLPSRFKIGDKFFSNLVSPRKEPTERAEKRIVTSQYLVGNLIYACVAFGVLWCSLGAYSTLEREYHIMTHLGSHSATSSQAQRSSWQGSSEQNGDIIAIDSQRPNSR